MEQKDLLTLIVAVIAIYGAGLSTYLGYHRLKEGRRQVKVDLDISIPEKKETPTFFWVRIVNTGFRTVKITEGEIKRFKFRWIPMEEVRKIILQLRSDNSFEKFPVTLQTGHDFRKLLFRTSSDWPYGEYVQAYIYDIEGNVYKSRKIRHKPRNQKASDNLK